jgi:hypothetical protein
VPAGRAGKYMVKIGDKVVEVSKSAYNKIRKSIKEYDPHTMRPGHLTVGKGKTPKDFGFSQIAENPEQLKLWNDTLKDMAAPGKDNAYTKYLNALVKGEAGSDEATAAYNAVVRKVRIEAKKQEIDFDGVVHHWNYNKGKYPEQAVNPANLSQPITPSKHLEVHRETTSGHTYNDPIKVEHELPINAHPIVIEGNN